MHDEFVATSPKRVLVVEDEAVLAETLRTWLESAGYDVCGPAAGAGEALDLAMIHYPHLAVMDVCLAGGEDGVLSARELERCAGTPALFFTAYPEAVMDGRVGVGHVAKPSGEREFLAAVQAAFAVVGDAVLLRPPAGLHLHGSAAVQGPRRVQRAAHFRALFDCAPQGIALVDGDLRIVEINPACAQLFGLDAAALAGGPLEALPGADERVVEAVAGCLAAGRSDVPARETVGLRADGRPLYARVSGVLIRESGHGYDMVALHVEDLTALREAERATRYLGQFDPETGLATCDLFHARLDRARARLARMGTPFAVLLIELDDLHGLEARHGPEVAGAVIVAVADRIDDRRREVDTAARFEGGRYAVLLEGTTHAGARTAARDVLGLAAEPVDVAGLSVGTSACIGVAWCSDARLRLHAILERAETALERAKLRGSGHVDEA